MHLHVSNRRAEIYIDRVDGQVEEWEAQRMPLTDPRGMRVTAQNRNRYNNLGNSGLALHPDTFGFAVDSKDQRAANVQHFLEVTQEEQQERDEIAAQRVYLGWLKAEVSKVEEDIKRKERLKARQEPR